MYDNLKEHDVIDALKDITDEPFLSIENELRRFLREHLEKDISDNF